MFITIILFHVLVYNLFDGNIGGKDKYLLII